MYSAKVQLEAELICKSKRDHYWGVGIGVSPAFTTCILPYWSVKLGPTEFSTYITSKFTYVQTITAHQTFLEAEISVLILWEFSSTQNAKKSLKNHSPFFCSISINCIYYFFIYLKYQFRINNKSINNIFYCNQKWIYFIYPEGQTRDGHTICTTIVTEALICENMGYLWLWLVPNTPITTNG